MISNSIDKNSNQKMNKLRNNIKDILNFKNTGTKNSLM